MRVITAISAGNAVMHITLSMKLAQLGRSFRRLITGDFRARIAIVDYGPQVEPSITIELKRMRSAFGCRTK
jgi:hypothetical protein